MAFSAAELTVVNQSLDRIGSTKLASIADTTSAIAKSALLHYSQVRDALLRSHDWKFATKRQALAVIKTLAMDAQPTPDNWIVGDTITGIESGVTATIITVTSPAVYEIAYISGTFTDGEKLTNGTVEIVYWNGLPVTWEDAAVYWWDTSLSDDVQNGTGYPVVATSSPISYWTYQYLLPSDYLRFCRNYQDDHWKMEGKRILSWDSEMTITYIWKVTDPAEFDALFSDLLILTLALRLIPPLAGTMSQVARQELKDELRAVESRARVVDSQEANVSGNSNWNDAREGIYR
jgi:hypothetical protein